MFFLAAFAGVPLMAQLYPEDAQVNLYFPHLADGGTGGQQRWQTRFNFVNPSSTSAAAAALFTYSDDGSPWNIDLGSGPKSMLSFSVPPQGRVTLTSKIAEAAITTGWAYAFSDVPLEATLAFRALSNNQPTLDLTAPATLPSQAYRSAAGRNLGIALANQYNVAMSIAVTAIDQSGAEVGSAQINLPPSGHKSFNLFQAIPSLPSSFLGSVLILPATQAEEAWQFLAWTANEDSGMLSTLPSSRAEWPISHYDRIWLVFLRVLDAAIHEPLFKNVNFGGPQGLAQGPVVLDTPFQYTDSSGTYFNAASNRVTGHLTIPYSLSELISDSPSEIAFLVAHELGHQIQGRIKGGQPVFSNLTSDIETDADIVGMLLSLEAGYDPYAGAGALAKLAMGDRQASPLTQVLQDVEAAGSSTAHPSLGARITELWTLLTELCATSAASATCQQYKVLVHPDFPLMLRF